VADKPRLLAERLTQILSAYAVQDVLGLKRYESPDRILNSILVSLRADSVTVHYKGTNNSNDFHTKEFEFSEGNEDLRFVERPKPHCDLSTIPCTLWRRILDYLAVQSTEGVLFDLDTHRAYGLTPYIFQLDRTCQGGYLALLA
jgi:hypothetical protein